METFTVAYGHIVDPAVIEENTSDEGFDGDNGHVVAGPDIVTRGFVYVRDSGDLMSEAQSVVADTMDQLSDEGVTDWGRIKNEVKSSLSDYVWKQTQRSPMIIPIIMEI
ncbi:MAG: hypothetical protein IKR14_00525 [Lachnospiraceae bacterium]|nr:hypothetical protein [Lachnospiraceae bacterium]